MDRGSIDPEFLRTGAAETPSPAFRLQNKAFPSLETLKGSGLRVEGTERGEGGGGGGVASLKRAPAIMFYIYCYCHRDSHRGEETRLGYRDRDGDTSVLILCVGRVA